MNYCNLLKTNKVCVFAVDDDQTQNTNLKIFSDYAGDIPLPFNLFFFHRYTNLLSWLSRMEEKKWSRVWLVFIFFSLHRWWFFHFIIFNFFIATKEDFRCNNISLSLSKIKPFNMIDWRQKWRIYIKSMNQLLWIPIPE